MADMQTDLTRGFDRQWLESVIVNFCKYTVRLDSQIVIGRSQKFEIVSLFELSLSWILEF